MSRQIDCGTFLFPQQILLQLDIAFRPQHKRACPSPLYRLDILPPQQIWATRLYSFLPQHFCSSDVFSTILPEIREPVCVDIRPQYLCKYLEYNYVCIIDIKVANVRSTFA